MKLEFVLVDFENVQPKNASDLIRRPFKIRVFVGSNQKNIPLETVQALQPFGPKAQYIQVEGNGHNALDFHIAYYIGRLSAENPGSTFHIVSKDTGFDPLIRHLRAGGIRCHRSGDLSEIGEARPCKVEAVINNLAKRKTGRPSTRKTLRSTIKAFFVNQVSDKELDALIEQLIERGTVRVADGKVEYALP